MALLPIITAPDELLRKRSEVVKIIDKSIQEFMDDMLATMYHSQGVGLAAIQVGIPKQILVIDMQDLTTEQEIARPKDFYPLFMINPQLIVDSNSETVCAVEGCLSLPNQQVELERPDKITIRYQDYWGKDQQLAADGWLSRAIQHEHDHLLGKLLLDYLSKLKQDTALRKLSRAKREVAS